MFKSGRWKTQNKIKVMFQLQFQATQVPKLKGKGLMVSLIPADIGKPIARLEKAPVVEGTCTWEDPIYEMVKLVKNQKTETYKEKIYYFNVATGSSKSGFVGEVGVDFANFVESNEPFQLSLPLTASNTGAILHVFIQKMQRTDEQREFEESEESLQSESLRSKNQASDNSSENGNILDFTEENNRKNNSLNKKNGNQLQQRSSNDWSLGSLSDRSMADILNSPEHNLTDQTHYAEATSKNAVEVLKSDVSRLERQAELSELELETLRKQILKENKRGQELLRKITELREEKEALETECDQLKSSQNRNFNSVSRNSESEKLKIMLEEMREELKYEKGLNKSLNLNLSKTEESNSELLIKVKDFDRKMEEKDKEISYLSEKVNESQIVKDEIQSLYAEIELQKKEKEELKVHIEEISIDYKYVLQENEDLSSKLEQTQIEQMELQNEYSKSLTKVKQYELQIKRLEEKIVNQAMEISQSLDTITEFESHIKSLEKELEKQGCDFEDDVEDLMKSKVEQEQRVIKAEEALKKSTLTNATIINNLQDEIKTLSIEMKSKVDEKESIIMGLEEEIEKCREEILLLKDGEKDVINEKEFNSLKKESMTWTSLISEKNVMVRTLQSELKMLRGDYNEMQQRLLLIESEKVNLQKEVSRLEATTLKESKVASESRSISKSAKSNDEQKLNKLQSEISSLDEKNKHMESELKEMQEKYSEISLRFAEVEGERQQLVMTLRNLRNGKKI